MAVVDAKEGGGVSAPAGAAPGSGGGGGGGARAAASSLLESVAGDLPVLLGALLVMCYAEDAALADPAAPRERSVFGFAYDLASAFGTSGLTLSPNELSTSASLGTLAQLVVIYIMLRGRMRGLPLDADACVASYSLWALEDAGELDVTSGGAGGATPAANDFYAVDDFPMHTVSDDHAFTVGVNMLVAHQRQRLHPSLSMVFAPVPDSSPGGAAEGGAPASKGEDAVGALPAAGAGAPGTPRELWSDARAGSPREAPGTATATASAGDA